MRTVKLICPVCRDLVEVIDKTVADHLREGEPCPMSGMRHCPSPRFKSGPGGPSLEVLGARNIPKMGIACDTCGEDHGGFEVLARMHRGDPSVN